jgi:hypothetical protein
MEKKAGPVGGIHPDHQEFTVGKIDNVHHAKDNGQPKGDQSKEKAHQDPLKDCIEDNHKEFPK